MAGSWSGVSARRPVLLAVSLLVPLAGAWAAAPAQAGPVAATAPARPPGGIISTVAGGIGGPGRATNVSIRACGLKSAGGALYFAYGPVVRRVDERTDRLTTVTAAIPGNGCGVAADAAGNVLVAGGNQVLVAAARTGRFYGRRMLARHVYAIAWPQNSGHAGNGGLATRALLEDAAAVTLDRAGNVVVADSGIPGQREEGPVGAQVRIIAERTGRFYGRRMTAGHIYSVAGTGTSRPVSNGGLAAKAWLGVHLGQVVIDRTGNLVLADRDAGPAPAVRVIAVRAGRFYGQRMSDGHIYRIAGNGRLGYSGNGGPARSAALNYGGGVALDQAGNVVIGDCDQVRVVAVRTGRFYGRRMLASHIYAVAGQRGSTFGGYCFASTDAGDGLPAARASVVAYAVTVDVAGNVLLPGANGARVRLITARTGRFYGRRMRAGDIYTVPGNFSSSGDGLLATRAELTLDAVTADRTGDIFLADSLDQIRMVTAASGPAFGRSMVKGVIYRVAGGGSQVPADGVIATAAQLNFFDNGPVVAADAAGNLVAADTAANQIDVIARRNGTFYGQSMTAGRLYLIAGTGTAAYAGDGGPATTAGVPHPGVVTVDPAGDVLTDSSGRVRLIAARTGTFYGQSMTAGDIYTIAGDGTGNYTGDGGPATATGVPASALAADPAGNAVIADGSTCLSNSIGPIGCRVWVVPASSGTFYGQPMTAGNLYPIAGDGTAGNTGDDGPATKAGLYDTVALAVDSAGNIAVVVSPYDPDAKVRMIAARSGTFYGRKMTAGDIYTIAGGGTARGDGGPAIRATLNARVVGIAIGPSGGLLIAELTTGRIRSVSR